MNLSRRQFTRTLCLSATGVFGLQHALYAETHVVRRGDTLSAIALQYNVSIQEIKAANNLGSDIIRSGQRLQIPTRTGAPSSTSHRSTYTVSKGDTLSGIALSHGTNVRELKQINNLRSDTIRVGQKLNIPTYKRHSTDYLSEARRITAGINVRRDNWKRIVVHHSAIKYGNATVYDKTHRQRGMQNGLAYHFLIGNGIDSADGEIEVGPRWNKQLLGGHVKSYQINLTAIGICLVGNFEEFYPTQQQLAAFTQLMDWLQSDVLRKKVHFAGHRELKGEQTICPGKNFPLAAMHRRYD